MVACHCLNGTTCDRQGFDSPWRYDLFAGLYSPSSVIFAFLPYFLGLPDSIRCSTLHSSLHLVAGVCYLIQFGTFELERIEGTE